MLSRTTRAMGSFLGRSFSSWAASANEARAEVNPAKVKQEQEFEAAEESLEKVQQPQEFKAAEEEAVETTTFSNELVL